MKKITKSEWKRICIQLGKWCSYEEVSDMTYEQAVEYIRNMNVWAPM